MIKKIEKPSATVFEEEYFCDHCQTKMYQSDHWQSQCLVCGKDTCYQCQTHYPFRWFDNSYYEPEDQPRICKSCLVPMAPILKALEEAEAEYDTKIAPLHAEGVTWMNQVCEAKKAKRC